MIRHDGAINHIYAQFEALSLDENIRFLQTAPISSDISVWQYLGPILTGGRVIVVDNITVLDAKALLQIMQERRATLAEYVPAIVRNLLEYVSSLDSQARTLDDLRTLMITGEALPVDLVNWWLKVYPDIAVVNAYGPTEASDDVTQAIVTRPLPQMCRSTPIGRPLANCVIYIVDPYLRLAPPGIPGEICVSGVCVGEGYWRNDDKTQASFVPDPYATRPGQRMYRTGDLGRWLADGQIEFLGRVDQQVKLRGFRIELQEVEAALRDHPQVRDAVATVWEDPRGQARLVAYTVASDTALPTPAQWRTFLGDRLPAPMVPAIFVPMAQLPLTPAGKVDRRNLPPPTSDREVLGESYVAPRSVAERLLAELWAQTLHVPQVGIHDNFCELGGDSLNAMEMIALADKRGFNLQVWQVFRHPTVAQLAAIADTQAAPGDAPGFDQDRATSEGEAPQVSLEAVQRRLAGGLHCEDAFPLTRTQLGIYFCCVLKLGEPGTYVEQAWYRLTGDLDMEAFLQTWNIIFDRYSALRSGLVRAGGTTIAQFVAKGLRPPVEFFDCSEVDEDGKEEIFQRYCQQSCMRPFMFASPPLFRIGLVRLSAREHNLVLTYHHLIIDGWSERVILQDFLDTYSDLAGHLTHCPSAPSTFCDYRRGYGQRNFVEDGRFWSERLRGFSEPNRLIPPRTHGTRRGTLRSDCELEYAAPLDTIKSACRRQGLTQNTVLQGLWALVVARYADSQDVVFGMVSAGRDCRPTVYRDVVGLLVTTLPVRVTISPVQPLGEWLTALQEEMVDLRRHEAPAIEWRGTTKIGSQGHPLFQSVFIAVDFPPISGNGDQKSIIQITDLDFKSMPHFELSIFFISGATPRLRFVFDRRRLDRGSVERLASAYLDLLSHIDLDRDPTLGDVLADLPD